MAINRYTNPIEQSLEKYVPLPMDSIYKAAEKIQERGDLAQQQRDELETGLGSLEAYAPAQRDFISNYINEFRTKSSELLGKYQNNTSDPEFIRESRKLNMQFARDPRLQIIKQTNEKIKLNEQIAGKLQAEGKLFIKPEFTGVDSKGRLTAEVGNVQGINTLDEWSNAGKVAHASTELVGNMLTNERNLEGFRQGILGDVEGQAKLVKAYMQQGMSQQEAANAVKTNIRGIIDQYGVVTRPDTSFESLALQKQQIRQGAYQFEQTRKDRAAEAQLARDNALAIAELKAKGKEDDVIKAPSFNPFPNRVGAVGALGAGTKNSIIGSGMSQYGTSDKVIKNQVISGKIYDITAGETTPKAANVNIKEGTLTGYMNVWTYAKDGKLITMSTPTAKPNMIVENGKTYITKNGVKHEVVEKTVAKYDIFDKDPKTDETTVRTIYKEAAPKEAMREMGYSNAYYEGMGRVNHGSIIDSNGKAKPDWQYINKNITNSKEDLLAIKNATNAYNSGIATDEQKQLLQALNDYDSRKSTYDNEILPYFKQQSKTKTIVEE